MTRSEMGETIRPNYPVQRSLELFQSQTENMSVSQDNVEAPSISQLAKVFEVIDPIRDLLASIKWQPPAIVVLGNEKSGKSSLLERLAMIPIFPKAKQICTRMAIHVRLRRGPARPPLVEVYDKAAGAVLRDMVIPMEKGNEYVNDAMERILMAENDGVIRGICNRKMLVLHVSSPSAPNLDLVDLPGLVSTFVRGEPENMQALTRELVETYIKENSTHSMYLVTVPARSACNQSLAMEVVQRYKLQSRTIGVLTKSDLYATIAEDDQEKSENVRELCEKVYQRSSDVCPLPTYGYVATMNKPIREGQYATNFGSLMHQAEREKDWFMKMGFSEIVESGHATMGALVNRLSSVYHNYMRHTWAPLTILRLERERVAISQREQALGLPRADTFLSPNEETREGMVTKEQIASMATDLTIQLFKSQRTIIIDRICSLILKNFQAAIRSESIAKTCSPADAVDYQRQAKLQIENHCSSALDYLQKFMLNELKVILSSDKTAFCLHRFINLMDAILERSAVSLDQWRQDTETTMMNYVAMAFQNLPINPYLTIKYNFDGNQPMVKFTFDATSLADVLPHVMVLRLSSLITDLLGSTVTAVAQGLDDNQWIESCASDRKSMLQTVRMIETAEAELMQVLFISPADMETFIGGGKEISQSSDSMSSSTSVPTSSPAPSTSPAPPAPPSLSPASPNPSSQPQMTSNSMNFSNHSSMSAITSNTTLPGISGSGGGSGSVPGQSYSRLQSQSTTRASIPTDALELTVSNEKPTLSGRSGERGGSGHGMSGSESMPGITGSISSNNDEVSKTQTPPTKSYSEKSSDNWSNTSQSPKSSYQTPSSLSTTYGNQYSSNSIPPSHSSADKLNNSSYSAGNQSSTLQYEKSSYDPTNYSPANQIHSNSYTHSPGTQKYTNPTPNNTPATATSTPGQSQASRYSSFTPSGMDSSSSPYNSANYGMSTSAPALASSSNASGSGGGNIERGNGAGEGSTGGSSNMPSTMSAGNYEPASPAGMTASSASSSMMRLMMERGNTHDTSHHSSQSTTGPAGGSKSNGSLTSNTMNSSGYSLSYNPSGGGIQRSSSPSGSTSSPGPTHTQGMGQPVISSSLNKTARFDSSGAMYDPSTGRYEKYEGGSMDRSSSGYSSYSQATSQSIYPGQGGGSSQSQSSHSGQNRTGPGSTGYTGSLHGMSYSAPAQPPQEPNSWQSAPSSGSVGQSHSSHGPGNWPAPNWSSSSHSSNMYGPPGQGQTHLPQMPPGPSGTRPVVPQGNPSVQGSSRPWNQLAE
eukprot:CAMPEP_0182434958 /NCGR_PEP_ID=MMETSP1167-20130531/72812_1 /TAXON_ID=2988 /ORGANISM="Mallomonas Sp, Strain CCMP3275" /LENGTH=1273 /DNA_ID=CAMNT_0024625429 /DNA_START=176 /DNA_END=3997 /DNA_ORIENTATION=-